MNRSKSWLLLVTFSLCGCAQLVPVPTTGPLPEILGPALSAPTRQAMSPPVPLPMASPQPILAGERSLQGVTVDAALEAIFSAQASGNLKDAIDLAEQADRAGGEPARQWLVAVLRTHLLNLVGRASEAEALAAETARREIALRGSDLVARTLRGDAHVRLGDFSGARKDYHAVLRALGDWRFPTSYGGPPTNPLDLALTTEARTRATLGMAFAETMAGQPAEALAWSEEAERHLADLFQVAGHALYGPIMGKMPPDLYIARAVNLAFIGSARLALGMPDTQADGFFIAADAYYAALGHPPGAVHVQALRAMGLLHAGRFEDARRVALVAAHGAEAIGLDDLVWRIQGIAGEALFRAGRKEEAETALREAQQAMDRLVGMVPTDRDKRRLGVGKDDITYRLAHLDFERGDPSTLFRDMERGRARAFVDMVSRLRLPGKALELDRIAAIDQQARQLADRAESTGRTPEERTLLDRLAAERHTLLAALALKAPQLAEARGIVERDLGKLQQTLRADESLAYWLPYRATDKLRLLVINRRQTRLVEIPTTGAALENALTRFAAAVVEQDNQGQVSAARTLTDGLAPAMWSGSGATFVVPTGALHGMPWGVLDLNVPVVVIPTGAWPISAESGSRIGRRAIIVGDPDFEGRLGQLPGARVESEEVAGLYGLPPLIGKAANENALREAIGNETDVLHLATHGKFFPQKPLQSAIYLAQGKPLTAEHLFEKPMVARLVVLSACETGIGKAEAGDDLLGLPRSFYLGGTKAMLSSLWEVDDEGTREFMTAFHRRFLLDGNLGQAWLQARNHLKKAGNPPWVYGAFVLGGSREIHVTQ